MPSDDVISLPPGCCTHVAARCRCAAAGSRMLGSARLSRRLHCSHDSSRRFGHRLVRRVVAAGRDADDVDARRCRHVVGHRGAASRAGGVRRRSRHGLTALHVDDGRVWPRRHPDGQADRPLRRQPAAGVRDARPGAGLWRCCARALVADLRVGTGSPDRLSRKFRHVRAAAGRHFALVRAPTRSGRVDRGLRQLPGGHGVAADRAVPDRGCRLAPHAPADWSGVPADDAASDAGAAASPSSRRT